MNNILAMLKLIVKLDKWFVPITFLKSLSNSLILVNNIYFPYIILKSFEDGKGLREIGLITGVYLAINCILTVVTVMLNKNFKVKGRRLFHDIELSIGKKAMEVRFEEVENPEILELKEKAMFPIRNQGVVYHFVEQLGALGKYLLALIMIGGALVKVHYIMFVCVFLVIVMNVYLTKKSNEVEKRSMSKIMSTNRAFVYFVNLVVDFTYAKDIRLFNLDKFIRRKIKESQEKLSDVAKEVIVTQGSYMGLTNVNIEVQTLLITLILVYMVYGGRSSISDVVVVIGALSTFSKQTHNLIATIMSLSLNAHYFEGYFQFFKRLEKRVDTGSIEIDKIDAIELRGVSFRYPKQEEDVLKGVDLEFHKGINYSLVGLNGAGKTTLIKLLTKLYKPTEGKILINGIDLEEIDTVSYRNTLSCVLQDFKMFAFNLEENIVMEREVDRNRVETLIGEVGMGEKVAKLKNGLKTQIYKIFDKEGIEFSGGQSQKLAIARARYRGGDLLIFDEPTASLDPIAEEEIFRNLYSIMEEEKETKISIFISHRLSSCRLSDQIYVLDKGNIIEKGSFEKLTDNSDGLFNKMWNKQAEYYIVEDEEEKAV